MTSGKHDDRSTPVRLLLTFGGESTTVKLNAQQAKILRRDCPRMVATGKTAAFGGLLKRQSFDMLSPRGRPKKIFDESTLEPKASVRDLMNHAFKLVNTPPWQDVVNKLHIIEGWQKISEEERQKYLAWARRHPLSVERREGGLHAKSENDSGS